jgi:hypothetical protein
VQSDRQDGRTDRQGTRQENRTDRQGNRQEGMTDRQENRQDFRDDARDDWQDWGDDYYHGGWDDWDDWYPWGAVATGVAVGAAAYAIGTTFATLPCTTTAVVVGGVTYYQCGATWYQPAYAGGSVTYVVVGAP